MSCSRVTIVSLALAATPCLAQPVDHQEKLVRAQELARMHRYQEVLDLLQPLEDIADNREFEYVVAAELGRAWFHLGQYRPAYDRFRRAAALRPDRLETALYLEATAYLLGDREQAMMVLREVLRSGAKDLYVAVTLPGERLFLADPEVWRVIDEFAVPMEINLENASVLGVSLGQPRVDVEAALGAGAGSGRVLTAEAGPHLIWGFAFSEDGTLGEVTVHIENVVKYTPYRPALDGLDWFNASPAHLTAILGPPTDTSSDADQVLVMTWRLPQLVLTAAFGHPRSPRPPSITDGVAMLRTVRIRRPEAIDDARMRDSDTIPP
jgi:tetratricopeptide (TPR) repeat protein